MRVDEFLTLDQYSLRQGEKQVPLTKLLRDLTLLHRERCDAYRRILAALRHEPDDISSLLDVPMLPFYALDDDMRLDRDGLVAWVNKHADSPVLIFGFTFMVWEHLLKALSPGEVDLRNAILVHSGGWKALATGVGGNSEYKAELKRIAGVRRVHNFYGMAEQIGTVFVECERGFLHAPNAADIIVRDPGTWEVVRDGETGVAQMVSVLPESYPGHSILTEDFARIEALDNCSCGRYRKAVSIVGRVPEAEMRGCSDTHAQDSEAAA